MIILHAFTARRPLWFRPSAIALGWVLGQYAYQILTTGTITDGICTDGTTAWRC